MVLLLCQAGLVAGKIVLAGNFYLIQGRVGELQGLFIVLGLAALGCFLLSLDVTEQAEVEDDQQNQSSRNKQVVVLVCFPKLSKHC